MCYSQQSLEYGEQSKINYSNTNKSIQNIITKKHLLTYPSFVHQIEFLLLLMLSKVEYDLAKSIDKKYIFEELQHKL